MGTSMRYFCGWRASSMMGTTLGRALAMLTRSRPERWENSTAYTAPVGPTKSETCDTEVPAGWGAAVKENRQISGTQRCLWGGSGGEKHVRRVGHKRYP